MLSIRSQNFIRNFGSEIKFFMRGKSKKFSLNWISNFCLSEGSTMKLLLAISAIIWPAVLCNSESEKWSWPTSTKNRTPADSRKDIYYENVDEKAGRIRVPTSYDNRRWRSEFVAKCWASGKCSKNSNSPLRVVSKCLLMQIIRQDIKMLSRLT